MTGRYIRIWLAALLIGLSSSARGIALADLPTGEISPTNEGYTFNWDYVYNYKGSSASAVDHYWILTAAHVADDGGTGNLTIGGETYTQQEVVYHAQADDPDNNPTADLALVRYDKPFPGYYLLNTSIPVDGEIIFCGYGHSGNVVSTTTDGYFTSNGGSHSTKRWGTNRIDYEISRTYSGPSPLGTTMNEGFDITISTTKGNAGKTAYEAGGNVYDSGSGMFYNDGGVWKLTGHMTLRYETATSGRYAGNFAVGTRHYIAWIKSVITDYDSDQDGLPDWWEAEYGMDETSMVATNDLDNDHFTNYEEWLADTIPTNGNSFLELGAYTNTAEIVFSSSTNRDYQIQYRLDLTDTNAVWATEVDWFAGTGPDHTTSVSTVSSNRFYRIRARLR